MSPILLCQVCGSDGRQLYEKPVSRRPGRNLEHMFGTNMEVVQTWDMPEDWQYREGSELELSQVFMYQVHTNIKVQVKA